MRITQPQISALKEILYQQDSAAQLYLFGSRMDDSKKGGDIDLLIKSTKMAKQNIRELRIEFYKQFGEQKIDIVLDAGEDDCSAFIKKLRQEAIKL